MTDVRIHVRALVDAIPDAPLVTLPRAWVTDLLGIPSPAPRPAAVLPPPDLTLSSPVGAGRLSVDRLLTVREVAARLGLSPATVYRHATEDDQWRPFVRKLGARALRFEERGVERYLATRQPKAA